MLKSVHVGHAAAATIGKRKKKRPFGVHEAFVFQSENP